MAPEMEENKEKKKAPEIPEPIESDYRSFHARERANIRALGETTRVLRDAISQARENLEETPEDPEWDDFLLEEEEEEGSREDRALQRGGEEPEDVSDAGEEEEAPRVRLRGRYRRGMVVGVLVLLFALIGVVYVTTAVVQQIYTAVTDDSALRAYDEKIKPLVMQDPKAFESWEELSGETVLTAAVWQEILTGDSFTYDETGRTILSYARVLKAARTLFGPDCEIDPSLLPADSYISYEEEGNEFHITPYTDTDSFTPYTMEESRSGEEILLRVGYVSAMDDWRQEVSGGEKPTPGKYMLYVLRTDEEGNTYISAVREVS